MIRGSFVSTKFNRGIKTRPRQYFDCNAISYFANHTTHMWCSYAMTFTVPETNKHQGSLCLNEPAYFMLVDTERSSVFHCLTLNQRIVGEHCIKFNRGVRWYNKRYAKEGY
jgi:hypothetical protein